MAQFSRSSGVISKTSSCIALAASIVLIVSMLGCGKSDAEIKIEEAQREAVAQIKIEKAQRAADEHWKEVALQKAKSALEAENRAKEARNAKVRNYVEIVKDKKTAPLTRMSTLDLFTKEYPEEAKPYQNMRSALFKDSQAFELAEKKAEASRRRKEGVRIGMSPEEVIASSWGKPQHVNRTSTAYGTREQWVYGGGYLYFEDGKLTTVQN